MQSILYEDLADKMLVKEATKVMSLVVTKRQYAKLEEIGWRRWCERMGVEYKPEMVKPMRGLVAYTVRAAIRAYIKSEAGRLAGEASAKRDRARQKKLNQESVGEINPFMHEETLDPDANWEQWNAPIEREETEE